MKITIITRIFLSILMYLPANVLGQSLNGKIHASQGNPIAGASILNLSTHTHTHSDKTGNFSLKNVHKGDSLKFTHIGYKTDYKVVSSLSSSLDIVLQDHVVSLEEVMIVPETNVLNLITKIDLQLASVNSSQEILRQVPGLFIGQHAGGGKAEQIFLRGFDIDHGTDIAISVDGMPVNMVSHAHGQGYADLHFVIPETIGNVDFGKGAYYASKGNFATAGYVDFKTKDRLKNSLVKLEKGQFQTNRLMGMLSLVDQKEQSAYVAAEYMASDGPFDSPQNFHRTNLMGKYTGSISSSDRVGLTITHFNSTWDASGQVPQRAVENGSISRFGAIDDTEGGNTSRSNVLITHQHSINEQSGIRSQVFYGTYDFELFSNFTFFLEDPVNGDQIRQKEQREIVALHSEYYHRFALRNLDGNLRVGIRLRNDQSIDNLLSHTSNRSVTLEEIQHGNIFETNWGAYFDGNFSWGKWVLNPALRMDYFDFRYNDALQPDYKTQTMTQTIVSPKLSVFYNYSPMLQLYLKGGKGFHSNDTRVAVKNQEEKTVPASYGGDAGIMWKPGKRWLVNVAYWYLFLEQEFVYVGDAGIVEPSGKTRRQGIDLSFRHQLLDWLFWSMDANYTHARTTEEEGEDYIPLAPDLTMAGGITVLHPSGWYGNLKVRYMKDRPANEDNSIVAKGYSIVDLNLGHSWDKVDVGIHIQNLLDQEWNEAQFATESRLQNESLPVEELHFTPGTPFFLKGSIAYKF